MAARHSNCGVNRKEPEEGLKVLFLYFQCAVLDRKKNNNKRHTQRHRFLISFGLFSSCRT